MTDKLAIKHILREYIREIRIDVPIKLLIIMDTSKTKKYGLVEAIFVLCEICHWCATYFDKSRVPDHRCPVCGNISISTFLILPNEEFTFNYSEKRGVELEFGLKKNR